MSCLACLLPIAYADTSPIAAQGNIGDVDSEEKQEGIGESPLEALEAKK